MYGSYAPPGYPNVPPSYDFLRTPPISPAPGAHGYYSPRYSATPSPRDSPKVHARRASQEVPASMYNNASNNPRMPGGFYSGGFQTPGPRSYYPSQHSTPSNSRRESDYVSGGFDSYYRSKSRRHYAPTGMSSARHRHEGSNGYRSSHSPHYFDFLVYDDYPYSHDTPPPPYEERYYYPTAHERFGGADYYDSYYQVPVYTEADRQESTPSRSRTRRASTSHSATKPQPPKSSSRPTTAKATPKATEEDARRAGIPAGYSIKNWDPTEEPIMLLGSVFDANSLGKWIYDWTVFHHGPATPMSEISGEMWLLLIQLAGKVKRAEESMTKIRKKDNRDMIEEFLESGDRLWMRFAKLLKVCEDYMWKAAKKESGKEKPVAMGKNAGCEFVDTIFGRDRELEMTEKLMTGMRLWSMRFDANCEEILRHPSL